MVEDQLMKKKNSLTSIIIVGFVLSLILVSCGKDEEGKGPAHSNNPPPTSTPTQVVGQIITVDQLISAVSAGKFAQQSFPGTYLFRKASGSFGFETCFLWDYKGDYPKIYGARALSYGGYIQRTVNVFRMGCMVQLTFDEDQKFGDTLNEIKNNLASYIADAKALHSESSSAINKQVGGSFYSYVPVGHDCSGNYTCQMVKDTSSRVWEIKIEGVWYRVDLNQALIQNPIKKI